MSFWGLVVLILVWMGVGLLHADPVVEMKLQVHSKPVRQEGKRIQYKNIEAFLKNIVIIEQQQYEKLPYVTQISDGDISGKTGDSLYVRGLPVPVSDQQFDLLEPAKQLRDPKTANLIGVQAQVIGIATMVNNNNNNRLSELKIKRSDISVMPGVRVMPSMNLYLDSIIDAKHLNISFWGHIVSVVSSNFSTAVQNDVVIIGVGKSEGLCPGILLDIYSSGDVVTNSKCTQKWPNVCYEKNQINTEPSIVPHKKPIGELLIYRVFGNTSLGLVLNARQTINVGNWVK